MRIFCITFVLLFKSLQCLAKDGTFWGLYKMFTTGGTAAGKPCMFPFMYGNQWYSDCTVTDHTELWCAVQTHYDSDSERWGGLLRS
uniref:Fibronectin type-II domain-containing protein n=1 Tax=Oryzias latipes TaxID=8090 RepID=A0A3P9K6J3_ORYLA